MPKPKAKPRAPLWKGPYEDGVTQSLLGRFLECRHRFWLKTICGFAEDEGFSRPLEFGNMWHVCEEARLGNKSWESALKTYRTKLERAYPNDQTEIFKWFNVCKTTFPIYLDYWSKHRDEKGSKPILEETSFAVPCKLPSGRIVILRGKWDALRLLPPEKSGKPAIYIKEHKTKGEIDEEGLLKTLDQNLQTMMYQIALRACAEAELRPCEGLSQSVLKTYFDAILEHPVCGVLYNVIRRPLADRYAIKQKKSETQTQFFKRLGEEISKDPKHYFMRWRVEITEEDITNFKQRTFYPILEQLCDWWDSIQSAPFDPWHTTVRRIPAANHGAISIQIDNPHHWQSPWGVHNSLAGGFRGSYFEYLTTGRDYSLRQITNLFPELA